MASCYYVLLPPAEDSKTLAGFLELPTHRMLVCRFDIIAIIVAPGTFFISFSTFVSCSLLEFKGRRPWQTKNTHPTKQERTPYGAAVEILLWSPSGRFVVVKLLFGCGQCGVFGVLCFTFRRERERVFSVGLASHKSLLSQTKVPSFLIYFLFIVFSKSLSQWNQRLLYTTTFRNHSNCVGTQGLCFHPLNGIISSYQNISVAWTSTS